MPGDSFAAQFRVVQWVRGEEKPRVGVPFKAWEGKAHPRTNIRPAIPNGVKVLLGKKPGAKVTLLVTEKCTYQLQRYHDDAEARGQNPETYGAGIPVKQWNKADYGKVETEEQSPERYSG